VRHLLDDDPTLWLSVSAATRPMRPGEVEGVDYFFMSRDEFEAIRDGGGFLEWFEVYGDLKGTPRAAVAEHLAAGTDVLLEIDVQGAAQVVERFPDALLIFIEAPSRAAQEARLRHRGDPEPIIRARLDKADAEAARSQQMGARVVINDDLERATAEVLGLIRRARSA